MVELFENSRGGHEPSKVYAAYGGAGQNGEGETGPAGAGGAVHVECLSERMGASRSRRGNGWCADGRRPRTARCSGTGEVRTPMAGEPLKT
ncbi:hypothetical protein SSPO_096400 [Streptomyces antimycoticus]|uniref:Uncharacterized protein n=1 Tax=Streptomyces antimycoticus TaxID=68175 RepID=A0A499V0B9_9ACTN|nr:hypothetical protein SSPO_096400 [Streptomyces antimycoticus]